ncbi:right-handed parallel beta-helix repeat-containing protein [Pseudodesulfovibrio cashew]|uniref:Right-handed parallel beta-helix repeat-containing protein n=1 Tax=Pseudodesulfovibrio cashew TaxID=2678688 RepID=A0A6I6JD30_9BACT|nr:right-handed parallel beta-helix repeat-containing protein [Pseudodesulfovibrio cashew]QGY38970.1 right-handed parallel beta-helix repeat-containing protein [Pseudodesulfovibrio cashew]
MHRIIAITALLIFLTATPAMADRTVVGTGDPTMDVRNVQAAVKEGGQILLRGRFNFGQDGRVNITKSVRILGERDGSGDPKTRITGGFWTFYSPLPVKDAPPASTGPIIAIHDIHFDGAKGTPLHFPLVGGLDVRGCLVTDVAPQEINITWNDGETLLFQAGIVVGNRLDSPKRRIKRAATGTLTVADNRFFMETAKPDRTAGYGIMADWTWGADLKLTGNIIHRASRNGIEALDNTLGPKGEGSIAIDRNRIITAEEGIPYPHKYGPNGIVAGWYFSTTGGVEFSKNNRITLNGNRIEGRGDLSTGMLLYSNDVVATCNDIIMAGGSQARGIVQTGSRGFFANNRVRGEARYAIWCHPFEALKASANTFAWTDLNDFTGVKGQVLLAGTVNVIIGRVPALVDKGKGNRVVETKPCALPEADPEGDAWEPVSTQ